MLEPTLCPYIDHLLHRAVAVAVAVLPSPLEAACRWLMLALLSSPSKDLSVRHPVQDLPEESACAAAAPCDTQSSADVLHKSQFHLHPQQRENLRISMRIELEILSSFDLIITTSTGDSECV